MIYLDNAASTPLLPSVKEKLISCLDVYGNPSSLHDEGFKARGLINESKEIISNKLNCSPDELYFTSGATMSNSLLLQGFKGKIVCSAIEHEDILMIGSRTISVDFNGNLNINELIKCLDAQVSPTIYSIQFANSEIGTIQDIKRISQIIHSYKYSFLHVDATQYIPHYQVNLKELNIDALSMSGQKIGCIKGIGLLYISSNLLPHISPIIHGKQGLVGGTENVLGIACLGEAFNQLSYDNTKMIDLRNMLINGLNGKLIGDNNRLPNNVCMRFDNVEALSIVQLLNEYGICCSAGSACSSGDTKPSSTLLAIGLTDKQANSCIRFTLSKDTTQNDILETIRITNAVIDLLRE